MRDFNLLSRYLLTRQCKISLPQKTSLVCRAKRALELKGKKKKWKLKTSSWGFALLDVSSPWSFIAKLSWIHLEDSTLKSISKLFL